MRAILAHTFARFFAHDSVRAYERAHMHISSRIFSRIRSRTLSHAFVRSILSLLLVISLAVAPGSLAWATGPQPGPLPPSPSSQASDAANEAIGREASESVSGGGEDASTNTSASVSPVLSEVDPVLAPAYNLVNLGQATTSKVQTPWGSCWAFAVCAALESSILKAQAVLQGHQQSPLPSSSPAFAVPDFGNVQAAPDLSERALAWFAHEPQTEESGGAQAGEGFSLIENDPEEQLSGGNAAVAASALTAWQSLLLEETAPYQYNGYDPNGSLAWYDPANESVRWEDWSLPEDLRTNEDVGWRVNEVLRLPSPGAGTDENGTTVYADYDAAGTAAIKQALVRTGGVAVALEMDQNLPQDVLRGNFVDAEPSEDLTYTTWSQYSATDDPAPNHAAVILGWDDAYPATNFAGTESGQPPANGAWLCKNSWGSDAFFSELGDADASPHWGLPDANGQASGFFWLSYYDHSLTDPQAFTVVPASQAADTIYQHDYLGAAEFVAPMSYNGEVRTANVFTAEEPQLIRSVGSWTFQPNTGFSAMVSVLPMGLEITEAPGTSSFANKVMENAVPAATATGTFEYAGYHTIDLDAPVLVARGQSFVITLTIEEGKDGEKESSYLGLELAFSGDPGEGVTTSAQVVANPGETFVSTNGQTWQSLEDYNKLTASIAEQGGTAVPFVFGNALVKAFGSTTNMADPAHIYVTVPLESS